MDPCSEPAMKLRQALFILLLSLAACIPAWASECTISRATVLPAGEKHGTAGAFVGVLGNTVVVAGGSDFPDLKPWEGGTKVWSDKIYLLRRDGGEYRCEALEGTSLPFPVGNGCSAGNGKILYCIGGQTPDGPSPAILSVRQEGNTLAIERVGTLPEGFAPNAALFHKGNIYICGSREGENLLLRWTPASGSFKELASCPGPALSEGSVLVYQHNGREEAFYLIGGRGKGEDGSWQIASHVWEYLPTHDTWSEKCAFRDRDGRPLSLMYAPALAYGSAHILVFGGDDGREFLRRDTLRAGSPELTEAFTGHPGFQDKVFAYHTITDTWTVLAETGSPLPAVTTAVRWGKDILIPSGEASPGVRSNAVLLARIEDPVSFGWVNYLVLALYLLLMMGVGFYFARKSDSSDKFFKGGGSIPWWAAGISIFATALSAITFLSIPAKAYATDWGMFMFNMMIVMVVPIVINFYLPLFRRLKVASVYEYLENRFSGGVRSLASAFFCIFMFARVAIVLFLPSLALNTVTGINIYLCILLMGVVTILYCTMGGIEAVVWGDVIQGFLLVGGAVLSLVWIFKGIDGGMSGFWQTAVQDRKLHLTDFQFDWTRPVFWVAVIGGLSNALLTYTSDQSVVQKYLTVKDTKGTERGLWLNGILSIPITVLFFGIGTALYVFFKQHPGLLNIGMSNTDSIYPHYMMCQLPVGVSGLLIAAVFAAAMSTLASNINSATTVLTEDFYARWKKGAADARKVRFARISGILVGGLGVMMAIALATFNIASLWDQFNFFLGLLTSGLGGLFLMGIAARRIGAKAALTGFVGSVIVLLLIHALTAASPILYGFLGLVSCFLIGYLSSFLYGYGR